MLNVVYPPTDWVFVFTWPNVPSPALCKMPKVRGPCRGSIIRWFYNTDTSLCEKFIYGGCKGTRTTSRRRTGVERCVRPYRAICTANMATYLTALDVRFVSASIHARWVVLSYKSICVCYAFILKSSRHAFHF